MNRPYVTLKLATSLDGRIATSAGESKWITGEAARAEGHRLRAAHDCVLVGAGTFRADNPELTARLDPNPPKQPVRAVMASRFDIEPKGRLFETLAAGPVVVIGRSDCAESPRAALINAGTATLAVPSSGEGVDLWGALEGLKRDWGVESVLAEGGGTLAAGLLKAGLVDRLEWFRAPILLGGDALAGVAALALAALKDAPAFNRVAVRELGPDLWESYERA